MTGLHTTTLSDVKPSEVSWLWPGRIPRAKVTLLCGDPGLGKSFVTMDMAARVTRARDWPDAQTPLREPGSVLVLSAEDDPGDTIRPRIEAAGGDPSRVVVVESAVGEGGSAAERGVCLDTDVAAIGRRLAEMERPRLIVIDPISAYMGQADSHNNAEVRGVLAQLARLAIRRGPAVVCVTHLNKQAGGKAVYRSMGSLAFTAAARMAWQIARVGGGGGDDERRAMALVKSNLPCRREGMIFRIANPGVVQWLDTSVPLEADAFEETEETGDALDEAVRFLRTLLAAGPRAAADVLEEAGRSGISVVTLRRAKKFAGVRTGRDGGNDPRRAWRWFLDDHGGTRDHDHLGNGEGVKSVGVKGEGQP